MRDIMSLQLVHIMQSGCAEFTVQNELSTVAKLSPASSSVSFDSRRAGMQPLPKVLDGEIMAGCWPANDGVVQ